MASQNHGEVRIAIARDPALVRTVRLVAAAVARRADCPESLVEEIRLAAGEACAIMIGLEEAAEKNDEQVAVTITAGSAVTVAVTGRVGSEDSGFAEIGLDPWALLRGLSEDLAVTESDGLTTAQLSWPR